jgi:glycosyltransferase involved in cell wall biosynthesis
LAEKVLWMHEHPHECERMGANAYNHYEKNYTPEKNYEMLISIYKRTIDEYSHKKF